MRLLNVHDFTFKSFDKHPEPYAILSHRWAGTETTLADIKAGAVTPSTAANKVAAFAQHVKVHIADLDWIWVDSCCINQDSAAELSEGVNCMFDWYRNARLCVAYLYDVEHASNLDAFRASVWFTRGWTLQELLASTVVVFVTRHWRVIGHKGDAAHLKNNMELGDNVDELLADITRIPLEVLQNFKASLSLSFESRRSWMNGRDTQKEEDKVYALYGIFDVRPGANYGEKLANAEHRLLEAIERKERFSAEQQSSPLDEELAIRIEAWLSPSDPSANHATARDRHETDTCRWLLQRQEYVFWKTGKLRHLWLNGKPGCGKSVLCSTVIQDLQSYCLDRSGSTLVYFYFTFSDDRKQSYHDLILSLTNQIRRREPARSKLRTLHDSGHSIPNTHELQALLISAAATYEEVFIVLDALDESPEVLDKRRELLKSLEKLLLQSSKLRLFATSRSLPDIRGSMELLGCERISIQPSDVSGDIQHYVVNQLSTEPRLREFTPTIKTMIQQNMSDNADGMFRWAFLLLDKLSKIKKSNQKTIKAALDSFPAGLDEIYNRILEEVDEDCHEDVLTLLRWIAYARRPLSLGELVDALVIRPENGTADLDDRCQPGDIIRLLTSLVVTVADAKSDDGTAQLSGSTIRIRLAHYTVQEYLESTRILESGADQFHIESEAGHHLLTQACLTYVLCYCSSAHKMSDKNDLDTFPLLQYAAESWYHHASSHNNLDVNLQLKLLETDTVLKSWLLVHKPEHPRLQPFTDESYCFTTRSLYHASFMGLKPVVKLLLENGADTNVEGGEYSHALQAAAVEGHSDIIKLLLDKGANVNAEGNAYGTALQAAARRGHTETVELLLANDADANANAAYEGNALDNASSRGHTDIVRLLLAHNADAYASRALSAASGGGYVEIVKLLLENGADREVGESLRDAAQRGHVEIVKLLLMNRYTDADASRALSAASKEGYVEIVKLLLDRTDNINAYFPVRAAAWEGHTEIVKLLLDRGADVNEENALQRASLGGHKVFVELLLDKGADVNATSYLLGTALHAACLGGHKDLAELLLAKGADVNATSESHGTALQTASYRGHKDLVELLLVKGADVNTTSHVHGTALQTASRQDRVDIVKLLTDYGAR